MKKNLSVLLAALAIVSAASYPVMAVETLNLPDEIRIVQPRYVNISSVTISFDRNGNIETFVIMDTSYDYVLKVELREVDGTVVDSWEEENGDVYTSYDLESGKRYYIRATVKVYNSSGRVIETATKSSSIVTAR